MSTTATTQLPDEVVWEVTNGAVSARALHVVAELGVADLIGDEPVAAHDLARHIGARPEALERLLDLLGANGIFRRDDGGYAHTESSRLLRTDHPRSMRAFARMMGLPVIWNSFGALDHTVRTGAPALGAIDPRGLWSYLGAHPDEARIFDDAMVAKSRGDVAAVVDAYDFRPFPRIADIGGGRGQLLRAALEAAPAARGVLFELPGVIQALPPASGRLAHHAGDFFVDPLPSADAYVLMEVIHDWGDADALAILRAIRQAASPGAVVLIIEGIVPDSDPDARVQTLDVIMLTITGGRERSAAQLRALFHEAGFRLTTVIPTAGPMQIVEAVAI
ncbi:MAG: hydroxyneurosporene methyltransferase [Acidimicrobiia bacterium]|nr:hydroxyneurosporene methyltransferase [Acidimicrobiia bacterium]